MFKTLLILSLTILSASCQFQLRKESQVELMKQKINLMSTDDVIQVLDGFFTTVGVFAEMPSFQACKTFDYAAIKDSITVISSAMSGNYWTLAEALYSLGTDAFSIYSKCDSKAFVVQAEQGWKDVQANFSQPDYFKLMTTQAEANLLQIMADMQALFNTIKAGQFNDFGQKLGLFARLVLVVTPK